MANKPSEREEDESSPLLSQPSTGFGTGSSAPGNTPEMPPASNVGDAGNDNGDGGNNNENSGNGIGDYGDYGDSYSGIIITAPTPVTMAPPPFPVLGDPRRNRSPSPARGRGTSPGHRVSPRRGRTASPSPVVLDMSGEPDQEYYEYPMAGPEVPPRPSSAVSRFEAPHEAAIKADQEISWSAPAGLAVRDSNDENLIIFRRAVGINSDFGTKDCRSLEEGRIHATGMYAACIREQRIKRVTYNAIQILVYASHFLQIIVGASLTALGPSAGEHTLTITMLGALNTVVAGVLALVKGQGLQERLRQDRAEFRKLQDWIEQTEALLAVGVIGRDRKEVGLLVQVAFVKYNEAKESEENNVPENYVRVNNDNNQGQQQQR